MTTLPGNLYVVAAPSGTGKTTLVHAIVESMPGITVSTSHTTRPRRPAEIDGVNYHFISEDEFKKMIDHGDFLEHAVVFNNLYGTSRKWVEETLAKGTDVILEIDWQGAEQIHNLFPESTSIFILPPSREALAERLIKRNQDKHGIIEQRLKDVREATSHIKDFTHVVMNDHFDRALHDLRAIIESGRLERRKQEIKYRDLLEELKKISE